MNYTISVIFRAIPVVMAALCVGLGLFTWRSGDTAACFVSGHVLTFLGGICLCLFATASVIIRQLIHRFGALDSVVYPVGGYLVAVSTFSFGLSVLIRNHADDAFVAGHVICGLGMICACVSTVATASIRFHRIPENARLPSGVRPATPGFSPIAEAVLIAVPVLMAALAWTWAAFLLATETEAPRFIAGHVLAGLAMICTCLIGLVASVVRQVQGTFSERERWVWSWITVAMGALAIGWGSLLILSGPRPFVLAPGLVMIGLGLVCFSILSKVLLLALVWRRAFPLANRIPLLPIGTALACLFLSAFLSQASYRDLSFFIPAHVLAGLGAICFSLFSIVSILESGTSESG